MTRTLILLLAAMVSGLGQAYAQTVDLAPPSDVMATDVPDDIGGQVSVKWTLSPEDRQLADGTRTIDGYAIYRRVVPTGVGLESGAETAAGPGEMGFSDDFDFEANQPVGSVPYSVSEFLDENCDAGVTYLYAVAATSSKGIYSPLAVAAETVVAELEYLNQGKLWFFIIMMAISIVIVFFVFCR